MPSTNNDRSVLTSIYNTMQTTIDNLATKFRNKTDDLLETMLDISIEGLCDNNLKNRRYMERLMRLNILEKDTTMDLLGNDAMPYGDSRRLDTNSVHPSYTRNIDYVKNFMEHRHEDYVRRTDVNPSSSNDYGNGNELYTRTTNLVPDELNALTGTYSNHVWQARNRDSILSKTKKLFDANKINTIISGFYTKHGESGITDDTDAQSQYGMSHGRNLLLSKAENDGGTGSYNVNGYNNPYCRVWTHHYQYNKLSHLIRPFIHIDGERGESETVYVESRKDFNNWTPFSEGANAYWKKDNSRWDYSVLNSNGFVNIAPKFKDNKIHAKQCMFSIENLAWKGYDPYSFEKALSWEQRGPMGGRIMWFPPYGIQFNETTQASWTNHTFIGRGEDVYTYTNTVRSGNLSFLMVVDHPSIIDYVSWDGGKGKGKEDSVFDSDLLRFFAGCDDGKIKNLVKPTPLTDEYTEPIYIRTYTKADPVKLDPPPIEPEIPEDIKEITFYVFYPNNYSGVYDRMGEEVEAIAYLLCGSNAQKRKEDPYTDYPLKFEYGDMHNFDGNGYEMKRNVTVTVKNDDMTGFIIGTKMAWRTALNKSIKNYPASTGKNKKQWYYRIDGKYEVPSKGEIYKNTYDQTLLVRANYKDSDSFGLNNDAEEVKRIFNEQDNDYLFSLAEVAAAISKDEQIKEYLINNKGVLQERVETLKNIINNYEITNINGIGYSNSHGNNASGNVNNNRNNLLAIQRIETVVDWFNNQMKDSLSGTKKVIKPDPSIYVKTQDVSKEEAKQWRSARMSLVLKKSSTTKQSETTQTTVNKEGVTISNGNQKYIGYETKTSADGKTYYEDGNGNKWIEVTDKKSSHYGELVIADIDSNNNLIGINETKLIVEHERSKEVNTVRYDQEYYFFKTLQQKDPIIFDRLMDKIQYFDPAFHSMTPEGFSARLTFLQQCTRQGNTIGASDPKNTIASNLAFGKPPFCVLRLGDFYNQMIVIDNISINYEPLMWDLNTEGGAGVIPLLANVTISFKFIGGGDMTGPVRRLQNAMTFNFYSNNSLFDNRSDRMEYAVGVAYSKEQGALGNEADTTNSVFYNTETYNKDIYDITI